METLASILLIICYLGVTIGFVSLIIHTIKKK